MNKFLVLSLTLLLLGCNANEKKEDSKSDTTTSINQTEMQKVSSALISNFMKDLKAELMKGIGEGGLVNAISACQINAPVIADNFSSEFWAIKRVTDNPRNPKNAVNTHEQEILSLFADTLKKLEFFDEWQDVAHNKDYFYYEPIYMGKFCLKCHGTKTDIDEEVVTALNEKYSDDKAIGYKDGDLRGMFVVQIRNKDYSDSLNEKLQDSL